MPCIGRGEHYGQKKVFIRQDANGWGNSRTSRNITIHVSLYPDGLRWSRPGEALGTFKLVSHVVLVGSATVRYERPVRPAWANVFPTRRMEKACRLVMVAGWTWLGTSVR